MKRCWILLFSVLIFCFCNGCAATDTSTSSENSLTITEFPENEESDVTPTSLPKSTSTPTPTVTPTPSPTPSVLEQIEQYEKNPEAVVTYPVNAALLVNLNRDEVLYSYQGTEAIYPASVTKLLTALTAFDLTEEQELQQMVTVSQTATTAVIPSAKMCGFQAGDQISLQSLLACMLIYSGNDSSVAVAEHLLGTEDAFVTAMNQKVQELGGISSNFCNTHGLPDDNHKTSAYDIYLIMEKLFKFEQFLDIIESGSIKVNILREEELRTLTFDSTNQFLTGVYSVPEGITMLGGKTGTTNKAGYCLSVYVVKDSTGDCYIAEIFGAETRDTLYLSMIQLLEQISEE